MILSQFFFGENFASGTKDDTVMWIRKLFDLAPWHIHVATFVEPLHQLLVNPSNRMYF